MNLEHISVLCYWTAVMWERGGNDRTGMLMRSLLQSINDHRGVSKADPCTSTTVPLRFHTHEWGFKKSLKIFTSYTFCYYPEFVCIRCYLMLISLHFLRSSVCAGPEELLWPAGLQRCWASLCLAPRPPGISRGASSRCGGVLLLPVHPRVALRGLSRVRIAAVFRGDVRGHYGVCVRDGGFGNGWKREEVKKASGEIEEWHISGGKEKKQREEAEREKDSSVSSWRRREFWDGVSCRQLPPFTPLISTATTHSFQNRADLGLEEEGYPVCLNGDEADKWWL